MISCAGVLVTGLVQVIVGVGIICAALWARDEVPPFSVWMKVPLWGGSSPPFSATPSSMTTRGLTATTITATTPSNPSSSSSSSSVLDGFVGSEVIFEDASIKIWQLTINPGEMTPMHKHNCDYAFTVLTPMELELFLPSAASSSDEHHPPQPPPPPYLSFTFFANNTMSFSVEGPDLVQIAPPPAVPLRFSRLHAARNPNSTPFREILIELKNKCTT